ncbi:hypothetical protein ACH5RR_023070 [Cinchona calisaya]|uniref:Autophagy-related protein 18h n=1 Tax=Cinchona calisaya TaxID=153742 RepID=A0ABD2ZEK4_9GENT
MKKASNSVNNRSKAINHHHKNGTSPRSNGFVPNSLKFISSCIKTVSSNVKSAGVSVAGSISGDSSDDLHKDQVLWASFDGIELGSSLRRVLLIGYANGFQVLDVNDPSNVTELVSRRDDPVTFLQIQPIPVKSVEHEGYRASHPMLLVVACDEASHPGPIQNGRDGFIEPLSGTFMNSPTAVRFYSLRSHNYVQVLRFRSTVYMVRCSRQIVAVGLAAQIYCFDALTLENKFSVLTYPVPQLGGQGINGVNIGYGPMAVGPRWLAYASNNPLLSNTGRLSPQSLSPSPGVSPSTSPGSGNLVARYAMESSKQLAAGLINLGDMGYKTLSKYCHELLPDGSSSPVSSNSNWKAGRTTVHSSETDAAGMVIVKDFASQTVISQFKAHTSPISALCFDPSGTLLVTASIHGNNINIFRILPSKTQTGLGGDNYDWSSSHVHLYKLHRGLTSAVIQDICFSHYSQWVAIVSSRGTCHIFVLSPFGGETGLQLQSSHIDGPTLSPVLSMPWWSTSFLINQQAPLPPPAPLTLSVICRIKSGNWLNAVSNAASSAAGKVSVPSGVVSAVFHSSVHQYMQTISPHGKALEHLLVYSPSGHLVQYELKPSLGGEQNESSLKNGPSSMLQMQEDDVGVKVEPVKRWDVCRRADWPEREEYVLGITLGGREAAEAFMDTSLSEDNIVGEKDVVKPHERSHWYLSNAEVQLRSGRIPIWQKSKVYFYTMSPYGSEEQNFVDVNTGGEIEIEKIPTSEVEIRRRELLPVFDHFRRIQSDWRDDRFSSSSFGSCPGKDKLEGCVVSDFKRISPDSKDKIPAGLSKTSAFVHGLDHMGTSDSGSDGSIVDENDGVRRSGSAYLNPRSSSSPESSANIVSSLEESYIVNRPSSPKNGPLSTKGSAIRGVLSPNSTITGDLSNTSSNRSDMSMKNIDEGPLHGDMHDPVDFGQYFQEGYCKASANNNSHELREVVTDISSANSPFHREKTEEDVESDGMLGGVFAFSEEG